MIKSQLNLEIRQKNRQSYRPSTHKIQQELLLTAEYLFGCDFLIQGGSLS